MPNLGDVAGARVSRHGRRSVRQRQYQRGPTLLFHIFRRSTLKACGAATVRV